MTKKELIEYISDTIGFQKQKSGEIVEIFFNSIKKNVKKDKTIKIVNFGTLKFVQGKLRKGINPITREIITFSSESKIKFIPSQNLDEFINS
ncbi:HU family DNA-binding protein [bacterium]|nr:HU family DNA-binding protein [bacterium]